MDVGSVSASYSVQATQSPRPGSEPQPKTQASEPVEQNAESAPREGNGSQVDMVV